VSEITLKRIGRAMAPIKISGTAPLIVNKFSAKARQIMLDKQMGRTVQRQPKAPEELYQASLYPMGDEVFGFPAVAFKAAIVDGARYFKGSKITMTGLKQMIFIKGEGAEMLVRLEGVPKMREDTVRNATGVADIRFRGEFWPWAAVLNVVYVPSMIDVTSILALVDAAGMGGVGEWRPASKESKTGQFGTWTVPDQDVKEILL
jgi:hypothetical protein